MSEAELTNAQFWAGFWESIENWAFLGVVLTLAIEFAALKFGAPYKEQLEKATNLKIAELNNETAKLQGSLRLAMLANTASVVSEEILAWSMGKIAREAISEAGKPFLIIQKIEPFAGKHFDAAVTSNDINLEALLRSLRTALKKAGWIEVASEQSGANHASLRGIRIDVDGSKDPTLLGAANTLASALNAEGISATVYPKPEANTANASVIHILIGPKDE